MSPPSEIQGTSSGIAWTATSEIGSPLSSPFDTANLGTGWLATNGSGQLHNPEIYDPVNVAGPIIPVNRSVTPWPANPANPDYTDELVVVWYENLRKQTDTGVESGGNPAADEPPINWPYQPVHYPSDEIAQPTNPGLIVMASRLGSAGVSSTFDLQTVFDPVRYTNVRIYNQPDTEATGYNPNEEHAIIADSIFQHPVDPANPDTPLAGPLLPLTDEVKPTAAFAFRKDLNVTSGADFSSDPLVLVECFDNEIGAARMFPYEVEYELPNWYEFEYPIEAGEPVFAPYPLNQSHRACRTAETRTRGTISRKLTAPTTSTERRIRLSSGSMRQERRGIISGPHTGAGRSPT